LQRGAPPWEGNAFSAALVETYSFYEIPLVGIIRQGDREYLFRCLAGELEPMSWWAYVAVSSEERTALESTASVEAFDEMVDGLMTRPGAVAVALEDFGIVGWMDEDKWDDPQKHIAPLLDAVDEYLSGLQMQAATQRERLLVS
jgi:hypothetical protein